MSPGANFIKLFIHNLQNRKVLWNMLQNIFIELNKFDRCLF